MADKIGINDNEYARLVTQLKSNQEDYLDGLDDILTQINNITSVRGGLQSKDVSANLKSLAKSIVRIKRSMKTVFEGERETINSFKNSIVNFDK